MNNSSFLYKCPLLYETFYTSNTVDFMLSKLPDSPLFNHNCEYVHLHGFPRQPGHWAPGSPCIWQASKKKYPTFCSRAGQNQPGHQARVIVRSILWDFLFCFFIFFLKNTGQTIKLQKPFKHERIFGVSRTKSLINSCRISKEIKQGHPRVQYHLARGIL